MEQLIGPAVTLTIIALCRWGYVRDCKKGGLSRD
jgi:hypothetical protein